MSRQGFATLGVMPGVIGAVSMPWLVLGLIPGAMLVSWLATLGMVALGHRWQTYDSAGVAGQVKAPPRRVPNTGGVAIVAAIVPALVVGPVVVNWLAGAEAGWLPGAVKTHAAGMASQAPLAWLLAACLLWLHGLGLIDDRRPLGPWLKLAVMAAPAAAIPLAHQLWPGFADTRLLTLVDGPAGGAWLSITITILWFLVVTNALNFMDNMDGLSAGVSAVAGACFLAGTLLAEQWFVAACLALLVGACAGFLILNFPIVRGGRGTARIFMGDSGSLVLGFLLAFLTTRTTYLPSPGAPSAGGPGVAAAAQAAGAAGWYAVLMPLMVLAVPLYDFLSVVLIRLRQGRSPFVGDMQHLSHRLVARGLSKRSAVVSIWGLTAVTGLGGIMLATLEPWQAALAGGQVIVLLGVLGLIEYAGGWPPPSSGGAESAP